MRSKKLFTGAISALALVSNLAFAATPCENNVRAAAAAKIRQTRQFHTYPSPYIYGVNVTFVGSDYKAVVSFGDASGSDTAEDSNCTVYTDNACRVLDVACDVR